MPTCTEPFHPVQHRILLWNDLKKCQVGEKIRKMRYDCKRRCYFRRRETRSWCWQIGTCSSQRRQICSWCDCKSQFSWQFRAWGGTSEEEKRGGEMQLNVEKDFPITQLPINCPWITFSRFWRKFSETTDLKSLISSQKYYLNEVVFHN